jgi:O-methyltransferase
VGLFRRIRNLRRRRSRVDGEKMVHMHGPGDTWHRDEPFRRAQSRRIEGIPDPRCFTLQSVIRTVRRVPGDVAECGVRFAKSTAFMLEADGGKRNYHLFDSFEGLSRPVAQDRLVERDAPYWKAGDMTAPEEIARRNLASFDNVHFYRGWIPDRFPEVADRSFALAHIDVDLYQPTRDSIEFFWPRLLPGGVLVCDDYGSVKCPGSRAAMDEFFNDLPGASMVEIPTGQAVVLKSG